MGMSTSGGRRRGGRVRLAAVMLLAVLVTPGMGTAPGAVATVNHAPAADATSRQPGGRIVGASGRTEAPNFTMDKAHPRQVLVDDTVSWDWTAPEDGKYSFDTHGSDMDTVLTLRSTSTKGGAAPVRSSDDVGDVATSATVVTASEGERFEVSARAKDSQTGMVSLSWHEETGARRSQPRASPAPGGFAAIPAATNTGEKPQSKAWRHGGVWWVVMASTGVSPSGTWLWELKGDRWVPQLRLSSRTDVRADAIPVGDVTHVLLHGPSSSLVSIEHDGSEYQPWSERPGATSISMSGSETATLTIDTTGRMWTAYDSNRTVQVRHSDPPYTSFSSATTLASGIATDDIAAITTMSGGRIGVMWSDQSRQRFGFRTHRDGDSPNTWTSNEVPAGDSARSVGGGMADDHINMALASDGSLYAAVKTSYDSSSHPVIALLVRQPDGSWDAPHEVARYGTRPIVLLDEEKDTVHVLFTETEGLDDIVMRSSPRENIGFSSESTVLDGKFNNVTSTKSGIDGSQVVLAASTSTVSHAFLGDVEDPDPGPGPEPVPEGPVGVWDFAEGSGSVVGDGSGYGNDGGVVGSPAWVDGVKDSALDLGGSDYVVVPDSESVGLSGPMSVAAWIRPERVGTQYVVKKGAQASVDGYEVGLASTGTVFVRLNHASSGNTFRVDSTSAYPVDGSTWMHVAAAFDGSRVRLFIDGVEQGSVPGPGSVGTNSLDLVLGAGEGGFRPMTGGLDQVGVYSGALTPGQIAELAAASRTNRDERP